MTALEREETDKIKARVEELENALRDIWNKAKELDVHHAPGVAVFCVEVESVLETALGEAELSR